jgi:acetyl esterase/lipase
MNSFARLRVLWLGGLLSVASSISAADLMDLRTVHAASISNDVQKALELPIATVVDKKQPSPTGDRHDYVSYGRYWWPDPAKSNGVPFIRRDGHVNREQTALGDKERLSRMIETVETLAFAWHLERREDCARRAGEWIRAWFVSRATRVNPALEHAQIRLGHDNNRGSNSGIIDARGLFRVIDSLRLLHSSPALTADDEAQVHQWFSDYLHWLVTSENGKLERAARNNHGTWYLVQTIAIARFLGRDELARQFARDDFARIASQFAPDGSQPLELARADGLSYCAFNLEAQFSVARLAAPLGVDLWNYVATNGASLRKGLEFLRPYNAATESWPYGQLKKLQPGFLQPLLDQAGQVWSESRRAASAVTSTEPSTNEVALTPTKLPGAETHIYREGEPEPMRLHVFKPKNWKADDRRPALLFFFGGGWSRGTPEKSAGWAKYAAGLGMVGVAPDYRTKERFDTSPLESVADGRAALCWVQKHAGELGIDPAKIAVGGSSAGGHIALWTAIQHSPPGSDPREAPKFKPAALILLSGVSDTSVLTGYTHYRFGTNAEALSPVHQLDVRMPPVLAFHGDADETVPLRQATALRDKLTAAGNSCELVIVPGGEHSFTSELPEWKDKSRALIREFLESEKLLPVEQH